MVDALRRRLDTGCTADSKDSGIEVRRMRPPKRAAKPAEPPLPSGAPEALWDIATFLWVIVFALTVWIFRLPMSIWFSNKIDWTMMNIAIVLYSMSLLCGIMIYINYRSLNDWSRRSPALYRTAMFFFAGGSVCFCNASFAVFGWMSAGICFVTLMFFLSLSEFLA